MYVNVCYFLWFCYPFSLIKDVCVWFFGVYLDDFPCVHQRRVISECTVDTSFGNQPYKWENLINKSYFTSNHMQLCIFHRDNWTINFFSLHRHTKARFSNFKLQYIHKTLWRELDMPIYIYTHTPLSIALHLKSQMHHWSIIYLTLCIDFVCYSNTSLRF